MNMTDEAIRNRVLTVPEVAAILRVERGTVYRLIETGALECTRVGRVIRVTQAQINRFLGE
jgi:excisionase family DNA binding protein